MSGSMTFREKVNQYDKESLKAFATELNIEKVSHLKKDDLIERIADDFLKPENLFYRLSLLDDLFMDVLHMGSDDPMLIEPQDSAYDTACVLDEMGLASFSSLDFQFLSDVREIYLNEIDHEKFRAYREKASWVWKCLFWTEEMYGFTPEDIFLKVVNSKRKMHMSAEELREIFDHFPKDRLMTTRFEDFYINKPYVSNKELGERIVRQQAGKDFYIPSSDEVEEYFSTHALLSKKCYQDLETFLIRHLKMDVGEAACIVLELWDRTFEEEDTHDVIQWFGDLFEFDNEAQVNEVLPLLMAAMNGTNLLGNRGYAPAHVPSTADDVL